MSESKIDKINPNYYKGNIECIEAIKASMTLDKLVKEQSLDEVRHMPVNEK